MAAIDAFAEKLRSTAEHVPASARRADALVELVNAAHAAGALPTRGGLPVALTVTLDHTSCGDPIWTHQPWAPAHGGRGAVHGMRCGHHPCAVRHRRGARRSSDMSGHGRGSARRGGPPMGPTVGRDGGPSAWGGGAPPAHPAPPPEPPRQAPPAWPRGSQPWRPRCSTHVSPSPWGGPNAPPPPPSAGPWRPATRGASSPGAAWPPKPARSTTSPSGRQGVDGSRESGPRLLVTSPSGGPPDVDDPSRVPARSPART